MNPFVLIAPRAERVLIHPPSAFIRLCEIFRTENDLPLLLLNSNFCGKR